MLGRLAAMGWRNLQRNPRRTWITVVALGGGLALSSASWVLMDGYFQMTLDAAVGGVSGHVQVQHPGQLEEANLWDVLEDTPGVLTVLEADPRVEAAAPRIYGAGLLSTGDRSAGSMLHGVDLAREGGVSMVPDQVVQGRWLQGPGEVVLGDDLAKRMRAGVGAEVIIMTQAADGSLGNALWELVGIVDTGLDVNDQNMSWIAMEEAEALLALGGAHGVVVRLHDTDDALPLVRDLTELPGWTGVAYDLVTDEAQAEALLAEDEGEDALAPNKRPMDPEAAVVARTWKAVNPFMGEMYDMMGAWMLIAVGLVLGTAGLGAMNTLLMSVLERTRELGILMAVGLKPKHVVGLIMLESIALAVLSTAVGLVLGLPLCWYVVERGFDLSGGSGGELVWAGVATEAIMQGKWSLMAFWAPVLLLLVISLLASIVPAIRAARLRPVDAMGRR